MAKVNVQAWAWVSTDPEQQHAPIISVDETKAIVAAEKKEVLRGKFPEHGKLLRSLYRKSKVVPIKITYEI